MDKGRKECEYQKRITVFKFFNSLSGQELSKLEKLSKEKHNIEIEEDSAHSDKRKRVNNLLEKITERKFVLKGCDIPPEKRQEGEIYMDELCMEAGLSTLKLYEDASPIPSLKIKRKISKDEGTCVYFLFGLFEKQ